MSVQRIAFLEEAREELLEAAAHYEAQSSGLGETFVAEVDHVVALAVHNPELGAPGSKAHGGCSSGASPSASFTAFVPMRLSSSLSRTTGADRTTGAIAREPPALAAVPPQLV